MRSAIRGKGSEPVTSDDGTGKSPRPYDARRNPRRGVRVNPLPRHMHREFTRFMAESRLYLQSQLSTWKLAARELPDEPYVQAQLVYWSAALRWMNQLEYLGTTNGTRDRP